MAKPKTKKADRDAATPQTPRGPSRSAERAWSFGVNDLCADVTEQALKCFNPTHHFKVDFSALCELSGVVPHSGLAAPKTGVPEGSECQSLAVQSMLMDLASMRVMRHVLPTSTQLQSIRLSSACLDLEMLHLLRTGLADGHGQSTVHTLHIDWNPVELPLDAEALGELPQEGALEALDELERQRLRAQAERDLRTFGAQLQGCSEGSLGEVLQEVAALADPDFVATALLKPLTLWSFTEALQAKLDLSSEEAAHIFNILDMPGLGPGDGLVSFARLKEALDGLPEPSHDEEQKIGAAFAGLLDGTSVLEVVSFRCCNLGCVEAQVLGKTLHHSQHLRALNLWGNRVCDPGAAALAEACEHYHGLQYLGLGRNLVTHVGLENFCKVLGMHRIDDKDQAQQLMKHIKDLSKDRDKKAAKLPGPKKDANGRERYMPEFYHVDKCEERRDPSTGQVFWVWARNTTLRTLVLEHNPIADAEAVKRLKPHGVGELVLRGTRCAEALLKAKADRGEQQAPAARPAAPADAEAGGADSPAAAEVSGADGAGHGGGALPPALVLSPTGGWRFVLQ